ncbi:NAD(+)/NADH kinase [Gottschalkiaceae bacterium SANA]|nr:NAD(+)/NADH kinase [Gottschalkiaceae bacterium SANA]
MNRAIGVIVNPSSGKDIRRIVSYADSVGHMEKMNLLLRAVIAAEAKGIEKIYFMPDPQGLGRAIQARLKQDGGPWEIIKILDFRPMGKATDTVKAVAEFERLECRAIVVMGGDGTSRDIAQTGTMIPILPISTGTNNVYPESIEGTIAGMVLGVVVMDPESVATRRDKRIRVSVNDGEEWIALVDVVCSKQTEIASRAVWSPDDIRWLAVTRATPASIGLSSIVGQWEFLSPEEAGWIFFECGSGGRVRLSPIIPGRMVPVGKVALIRHSCDEKHEWRADQSGTLALDGERMVRLRKDDMVRIQVDQGGPCRVLVEETLKRHIRQREQE